MNRQPIYIVCVFLLLSNLFNINTVQAQCACAATDYASIDVAGWTVGQTANITTCQYGGERSTINNTVAGAVYRISSCGAGFDTQLSIYTTSCVYVGYNDDNGPACAGTAASVDITSPGGNLYSVYNIYNCVTNTTCATISITLISLPCPAITDNTIYANGSTGTISVCAGSTVTISSSGGSTGNMCYWASNDGGATWGVFAGTYCNQASFNYTLNTPGSYIFHVRNYDACGYCWDAGRTCTCFNCTVTVNVDAAPTMGTLSNAGPINFCNAAGDWSAVPISVTGQTGTVTWQYGWSSGGWSGDWVTGASPGYCCFPKKVAASDGNADRIRYYVKNGVCPPTGYSSTILIQNRYNEAPSSLTVSATPVCSGTSVTLTANFPTNINILGTVEFFSGSCGGTLVASVTAGNNVNSVSTNVTPPVGVTTYYARYNPGTGTSCSATACVNVSVTVVAITTPNAGPDQFICSATTATMAATGTGTWTQISGAAATITTPSSAVTTITGLASGTYEFRWTGPCAGLYDDMVIVRQ